MTIGCLMLAVTATVGYDAGNLPKIFIDGKPQYPFIDVCGCSSTGGCATPNYLLDPATNRRSADFFACNAEVMADLLLALAKETKRVLPGRLVGAYYGYLLHAIPGEGANFLLDKVLASPDIDFLSDPPDYHRPCRRAGWPSSSPDAPTDPVRRR